MAGKIVFVYDDYALASLGASVSAMTSEDTTFPRANLVQPDRKVRARTTASPAGTIDMDIDLGQARSVTGFGVHYLVSEAAAGAHPVMDLQSSATSFASAASRITQTAAYWNTTKDWVDEIASQNHRYWRLHCTSVSARFSLGKVVLGIGANFNRFFSAGQFRVVSPNTRQEAADHSPVDMPQGSPYRVYDYRYFAETDPEVAIFERIAQQTVPWALLDSRGNSNHVLHANPGDGTPFEAVFDPMWNVQIVARQMP